MSEGARGSGRRLASTGVVSQPASRKPSTKELLIDTGERLFGQRGLDGISLREIAVAAGQGNSNVVQYHFKDKSGLVGAILEERVYRLETMRGELLQNLTKESPNYARQLLNILWLPSMTLRGADGSYTFCRFLLQYMIQPHVAQHPLARFYNASAKSDPHKKNLAHLIKATRLLRGLYTNLSPSVLNLRMSALSLMFLAAVVEHDNTQLLDGARKAFNIEPILDMAIAALAAPG